MINSWSYSRLQVYQTCPQQAKFKFIDKLQEPPRPDTGKEPANDRGSRLHQSAEDYINGLIDEPAYELANFRAELDKARELALTQHAVAERMWLFDINWTPLPDDAPYEKIWLRIISDITVWVSDTELLIIDIKSGKRSGNEIKHAKQLQLYQLATFLRYPEIDTVTCELWYVDQNELSHQVFTRTQGLRFFKTFNEEAQELCQDELFIPKPSQWNCRFCPFGPVETSNQWVTKMGACKYGV